MKEFWKEKALPWIKKTGKRSMPFLKKYGVALGVFCFGFHLHAQATQMWPLWAEEMWEVRGPDPEGPFYKRLGAMADNQAVTARWLMLAGLGIWVGVRYGLFERFRGGSDKPSGEE